MQINLAARRVRLPYKKVMAAIPRSRPALFGVVALSSFAIYLLTLAPTITWRNSGYDSGDFAAAIAVGGVPHPPGYPTYLILGSVFACLPFGDIAYRLNLLSAACAALATGLLGLIIHQSLRGAEVPARPGSFRKEKFTWLCAVSASLTFAFSNMFWSQAVITEVYALNVLFAAAMVYIALILKPGNAGRLVPLLFLVLGLSLGNHLSVVLVAPLILWPLFRVKWRWSLAFQTILAFGLGLSVYLIIPLRAATSPPVNWGAASTWPNFWWLVSASPYRMFLFSLPWELVPARSGAGLKLLIEGFMWWGVPVGLLGLQRLVRLNAGLAYASLLTFLLFSIYAIGYNTTDSYTYLMPALLIFAIWIGWGLYDLYEILHTRVFPKPHYTYLAGWGLVILPLMSLFLNFSGQNLRQDKEAFFYARKSLQIVAGNAIIVTNDDPGTFALWYGVYGLAWRPDVVPVNINLLPYTWYRQVLSQAHPQLRLSDPDDRPITSLSTLISQNLATAPIYLATRQPLDLTGYAIESVDHLQRVVNLPEIVSPNLNQ